jgi:hypothetical protein
MATETEIELAAMVGECRLRLEQVTRERDALIEAIRAEIKAQDWHADYSSIKWRALMHRGLAASLRGMLSAGLDPASRAGDGDEKGVDRG